MDMISSPLKTAKNVRNSRAFVKSSLNRQKVKQLNLFRRRVVRWDGGIGWIELKTSVNLAY